VVRLAAYHRLAPRWALLAGIAWTRWSRFDDLVVSFANAAQPPVVQPERWTDSFRYALGVEYGPLGRWKLRAGTAYDETPVPSAVRRTPRIPDSDRVWLALGVGYQAGDGVRFDFGYAHLFGLPSTTRNPEPVTGHVLRGDVTGAADILGLQLTWRLR
jgi:long-chain fatty acid transport protein